MVEKENKESKKSVEEKVEVEEEASAGETDITTRTQAEKILNDLFNSIRNRHEDFSKTISDYTTSISKPLADVIETDDEIIVKTDLPGVEKEDIDVRLTEDSVEIKAKFEEDYAEENVSYVRRERNFGESERFIRLPDKIKVKDASAKLDNSILTIELPKLEKEKFKVSIK